MVLKKNKKFGDKRDYVVAWHHKTFILKANIAFQKNYNFNKNLNLMNVIRSCLNFLKATNPVL